MTRAQWQGLSWIRYACRAAWGLPEQVETSRGGHNVTAYWRAEWTALPDRVRTHVQYHGNPWTTDARIIACTCPRLRAHETVQPSRPWLITTP